jgi:hypothetical protein
MESLRMNQYDKIRKLNNLEIETHLKNIEIYGYSRLEGVIPSSLVNLLKEKLKNHYSKMDNVTSFGLPERDSKDKIIYNLQNKDLEFIKLLTDESIQSILKEKLNDSFYRMMDSSIPNYILNLFTARSSGLPLELHIDSLVPSIGDYTWAMQVVYVLDDMHEDNGCTVVVPGSHKSGKYTDRDFKNVTQIHAKSGDIVIWDSRLWHGALENKTKNSRWALIATYSRWWVKQSMDMTRSMPNSIYKELTDAQKLLIGFCSIPPLDESNRIVTKGNYESLLPNVDDYY